jgi:hypothetical protein
VTGGSACGVCSPTLGTVGGGYACGVRNPRLGTSQGRGVDVPMLGTVSVGYAGGVRSPMLGTSQGRGVDNPMLGTVTGAEAGGELSPMLGTVCGGGGQIWACAGIAAASAPATSTVATLPRKRLAPVRSLALAVRSPGLVMDGVCHTGPPCPGAWVS